MQKQGVSEAEAQQIIEKVDEGREHFVKRFARVSRYDLRNYDLVLNMDKLSADQAVELILQYLQ